ncbi:RxLR effector protein [Phytophthora megakarya]|uniref:RxLR effector protein n=1 Tax=Phytophthora megakarya TaxID=4795 RepID=A0A225WV50_9STRA|nr:RxLR effector protein [Phytophthora megakarya]
MRLLQAVQVVLVIILLILASFESTVATPTNQVAISLPSISENLRRFLFTEERKPTEERSYNAAVSSGGEGGRVGAGGTGVTSTSTTSGGTVTVTKYWNNGLVQRFKRWMNKLISPFSSTGTSTTGTRSTRRLRLDANK